MQNVECSGKYHLWFYARYVRCGFPRGTFHAQDHCTRHRGFYCCGLLPRYRWVTRRARRKLNRPKPPPRAFRLRYANKRRTSRPRSEARTAAPPGTMPLAHLARDAPHERSSQVGLDCRFSFSFRRIRIRANGHVERAASGPTRRRSGCLCNMRTWEGAQDHRGE
jgi:hypothetical protein